MSKKQIPVFHTDAEAERFVETADLTEFDLSKFKSVQFEFEKKEAQLNMRLPRPMLEAIKERAKQRGIPYTRLIREMIEIGLAKAAK
jgi:predicted DNA binding CopG/RHH family protein